MAELKTKPTAVSVEGFLSKVADAQQRADSFQLLEMMKDITGLEPKMWGPTMVGFGDYHYVYASGHEGDCFVTGFSPRKGAITVYCMCGMDKLADSLKKLGKCKASKGCLYIKRLADVDLKVLRGILEKNVKELDKICKAQAKQLAAQKTAKKR